MDNSFASQTSPTLLGRLGRDPTDQAAWGAFVARYGPKIYGWCRARRLQEADAEDVTQSVLVRLAEKMRTFAYDPSGSFRAWLKVLTIHAWCGYVTARKRAATCSGYSQILEWLHTVEARDDLVARLEAEFDRELLDEAMNRVRLRVPPAKWEVFRMTALEGQAGADVARQLDMKVSTVFVVRSKVQKMVQEELHKLEGTES